MFATVKCTNKYSINALGCVSVNNQCVYMMLTVMLTPNRRDKDTLKLRTGQLPPEWWQCLCMCVRVCGCRFVGVRLCSTPLASSFRHQRSFFEFQLLWAGEDVLFFLTGLCLWLCKVNVRQWKSSIFTTDWILCPLSG